MAARDVDQDLAATLQHAAAAARELARLELHLAEVLVAAGGDVAELRQRAATVATSLERAARPFSLDSARRANTEARNLLSPRGIVTPERCRDVAARWQAIAVIWQREAGAETSCAPACRIPRVGSDEQRPPASAERAAAQFAA